MAAIRLCSSATCRCCSAIRLKSWECCRRLCCTALVSWGWELTGTETGGSAASNGEAAGGEAGGAVGAIWFLNAIILNNFSCSALAFWTAAVSLGLMASNVEPSRILNPPSGSAMYLIWKKTREIGRSRLIWFWFDYRLPRPVGIEISVRTTNCSGTITFLFDIAIWSTSGRSSGLICIFKGFWRRLIF